MERSLFLKLFSPVVKTSAKPSIKLLGPLKNIESTSVNGYKKTHCIKLKFSNEDFFSKCDKSAGNCGSYLIY